MNNAGFRRDRALTAPITFFFLVPFAVAFTGLPIGAFIALLVFLLLLLEGLVWAWSKGCLDWAGMRKG